MLDLMQLKGIEKKKSELDDKRQAFSEQELFKGIAHLEKFQLDGFQDPQLLKQGCVHLIEAMKRNRRDERPCLALAYLFVLIQDYPTANEYLQLARQLDPGNPLLTALQESIQEQLLEELQTPQHQQAHPSQPTPPPPGELVTPFAATALTTEQDFDALYDKIETHLFAQVKRLAETPPPEVSLQPQQIAQLEDLWLALKESCQQLETQIAYVSQEIDTTALSAQLRPLILTSKRYQTALKVSQELALLQSELLAEISSIRRKITEALGLKHPTDLDRLESALEADLDQCDAFADRIDLLESQGQNVSEVVCHYQVLLETLDQYRDTLDNTQFRLASQP